LFNFEQLQHKTVAGGRFSQQKICGRPQKTALVKKVDAAKLGKIQTAVQN
jgi:hypothetical protein